LFVLNFLSLFLFFVLIFLISLLRFFFVLDFLIFSSILFCSKNSLFSFLRFLFYVFFFVILSNLSLEDLLFSFLRFLFFVFFFVALSNLSSKELLFLFSSLLDSCLETRSSKKIVDFVNLLIAILSLSLTKILYLSLTR